LGEIANTATVFQILSRVEGRALDPTLHSGFAAAVGNGAADR